MRSSTVVALRALAANLEDRRQETIHLRAEVDRLRHALADLVVDAEDMIAYTDPAERHRSDWDGSIARARRHIER